MKKFSTIFIIILVILGFWWTVSGVRDSKYNCILNGGQFNKELIRCGDLKDEISLFEKNNDLIVVESPIFGEKTDSTVSFRGEARGYWFFEASFPVIVLDEEGSVIGQGFATARPENEEGWMTTNMVPFDGEVSVEAGKRPIRAKLVLKKDNPSGLPENDNQVVVPIFITE